MYQIKIEINPPQSPFTKGGGRKECYKELEGSRQESLKPQGKKEKEENKKNFLWMKVILLKQGKKQDEIGWKDENNLSLNLLKKIDYLLKKNKINKKQINKITAKTNQESYSSARISKIVSRVGNFCLTNFKK